MSDTFKAPLVLQLTMSDADAHAQLDVLAQDLERVLSSLGVTEVRRVAVQPEPTGVRAAEVVAAAFVLTALGTTADLIAVVQAVREWRRSRSRQQRAATLTVAGVEIGVSDADNAQILQAVAGFRTPVSDTGRRRSALIIANAVYNDAALSRLRAPAHDADALASVLTDPNIGGFDVQTVVDETEPAIRRLIADFFADRDRDDLLLVHYSGHGLKDLRGRLHLAGRDTDIRRLSATAVAASFLNDQMTECVSRHVVLILDCCYSGAFGRTGELVRADRTVHVAEEFGGVGRIVLTASSATEYAFEGGELSESNATPSVFTTALVRGLRTGEADADGDGEITIDELYDYAYREVRRVQPAQTPMRSGTVGGPLAVARSMRGASLPASILDDLRSNRRGLRLEAVDELEKLLTGGNPEMRETARRALDALRDSDDSLQVRSAAAAALAASEHGAHEEITALPVVVAAEPPPAVPVGQHEAPVAVNDPVATDTRQTPEPANQLLSGPRGHLLAVVASLAAGCLIAGLGVGYLAADSWETKARLAALQVLVFGAFLITESITARGNWHLRRVLLICGSICMLFNGVDFVMDSGYFVSNWQAASVRIISSHISIAWIVAGIITILAVLVGTMRAKALEIMPGVLALATGYFFTIDDQPPTVQLPGLGAGLLALGIVLVIISTRRWVRLRTQRPPQASPSE